MKNILITILFLSVLILTFLCVRLYRNSLLKQDIIIRSVGETQEQLRDAGYYHGRIDYIWGSETEAAYCEYKAAESLQLMTEKEK